MLTYGRFLLQANTQGPPLEPTLPERLLTPIQTTFAELEGSITAHHAAEAGRKQAIAGRNALRKEVEGRVRRGCVQSRQHLYTYLAQDDPILADYGLA